MHWVVARLIKYGLTQLTKVVIVETIKAFLRTRKGKAIVISLALGVTGYSLPPEAVEAVITLWSVIE